MGRGGASQSSIIPVLSPQPPRLGFCAFEASNSFLMDPSTLLPHPRATEKLSPSHSSILVRGSPNLIPEHLNELSGRRKGRFTLLFSCFHFLSLCVCYWVHNNKKDEILNNFSITRYFLKPKAFSKSSNRAKTASRDLINNHLPVIAL